MKAIVQDAYGSTDVLTLRDVDRPDVGDDGVLVRVQAAGIDPSVWHLMSGLPYLIRLVGFGLRRPRTRVRGWDVAGRVEAIGKNVAGLRPGDEVFGTCNGAFAEYACTREEKLAPRPESLAPEQAAAVPTSGYTALQALRDAGEVKPGHRVLIVGASGGVGTFAVQIAKALGAEVTGVCRGAKADLVRSIGADHVVDYTREDCADGRTKYDAVLDIGGNRSPVHLRRALTPRGILVMIGGEGGGLWLGGMDLGLRALVRASLGSQKVRLFLAKGRKEDLILLKELIESGKIKPVLDRTFPLSETANAIRYVQGGRATGKVVVTV